MRRYERYVALGDSSTEGLDHPDGNGGYRGWSTRLAERIAGSQETLLYANLGVRGRTTGQIRDQQLGPALAMRPDLATVFSGTNDVLARRFDANSVGQDMEAIQRALIERGARVLSFTLPDLTPVMPIARWIAPRIQHGSWPGGGGDLSRRMAARPTTTHPGAPLLAWHGMQPGWPRHLRLGRHESGLRSFLY